VYVHHRTEPSCWHGRFRHTGELIWLKTNQVQRLMRTGRTGHWLNHCKEHCLVGVKGRPAGANRGVDCDVLAAEVREMSQKPDEVYGLIERLSPGTRKIGPFASSACLDCPSRALVRRTGTDTLLSKGWGGWREGVEIFGRRNNTREGWLTIGNQLPGVQLTDPDILARFNARYPELATTLCTAPLPHAPLDLATMRVLG
jgi:mRNA m6A methyltransferase catalytic subunit